MEQAAIELFEKLHTHVSTLRRIWDSVLSSVFGLGHHRHQVMHRLGDTSDPDVHPMGLADDSVLRAVGATELQQLLRLVAVLVGMRCHRHYHFLGMRRRGDRGDCLLRLVRCRGDRGVRIIHDHCDRRVRDMGGAGLYLLRHLEHHLDHLLYIQCQRRNCVPLDRRIGHDAGTLQRLRRVGECAPVVETNAGRFRQLRQWILVAPCRFEPGPPVLRIRSARRWTGNRLRWRIL